MKIRIEISDDAISYGMSMETDASIQPQGLIEEIEKVIDMHIDREVNSEDDEHYNYPCDSCAYKDISYPCSECGPGAKLRWWPKQD